jgi:hypothetical protein
MIHFTKENSLTQKKKGLGVFRLNDGTISYGEWEDNKLNGYGVSHYYNESIYVGQYKNNIFHGFGEFLWFDGKYYCGEYNEGVKNGFGILINMMLILVFGKMGKRMVLVLKWI